MLSLFAAVCIVYLPFLSNPFVFDDQYIFSHNMADHYTHSLFQFERRWLSYASLGWTDSIFSGVLPHPFRLGNMFLHAANVVLLLFLLRQLISTVIPEDEKSTVVIWGTWFGALIFACHPVAVYAVGYVVERSILMSTLFSLVTQWAYLRGLLTGQKHWLLLVVCAYFMACFSKEHSVMVLGLLAAQTVLLRTKFTAVKGALWAAWIALLAIALLVVFLENGVFGIAYEPMAANSFEQHGIVESTSMMHALSALTQAGLFFKYLLLWLIPNPAWMSVDIRVNFVPSLFAWQGWLGVAGFVAYGVLGGRLLFRPGWMGLAGLALLYPWLQFVVEFLAIRVQEPFVLYRSYLWMPGMKLFFPLLLAKLQNNRIYNPKEPFGLNLSKAGDEKLVADSTRPVAMSQAEGSPRTAPELTETPISILLGMGFIAILLISLSWNRLWIFADNYRLWNDAALLLHSEKEVGADRIFYNRGLAEMAAQKWEDAIADFQRSVTLAPQLAPIHHALGIAYMNAKRNQDALAEFDAAIAINPDDASYYYAKGLSLKRLNQDDLAIRQIEKSCELKNMAACAIIKMNSGKK